LLFVGLLLLPGILLLGLEYLIPQRRFRQVKAQTRRDWK
tara:strand:+ start:238 stop:354 length:117 start_codon:yes stop_codon:yes gene_type:complete